MRSLPAAASDIGLAVSGGSDSMAMLRLMAALAPGQGWRLQIATVDHRLRPEAADEARFVARTCNDLGLPHQTLIWADHPATGNLMQAGSQARYAMLADWAGSRGLGHVLLAHTADDQAETFLMGLTRSAGLDGLTGMRAGWSQRGVWFHRPLLAVTRQALRDHLTRLGQDWCEDPSNSDPRYLRARSRRVLAELAPLGITAESLQRTIGHLAKVQALVESTLAAAFHESGVEEAGALVLRSEAFAHWPDELRRRLLIAAIGWLSGGRHSPRSEAVARLQQLLLNGRAATLGGACFRFARGQLRITREPRAVMPLAEPHGLWDHRWQVRGPFGAADRIGALGDSGLLQCPDWRATGLSRDQLVVSPAVWRGPALVAAPLARPEPAEWQAEAVPDFGMFVLSH